MTNGELVETIGGEALSRTEQKVTGCCGALALPAQEASQQQIQDIVEAATQ